MHRRAGLVIMVMLGAACSSTRTASTAGTPESGGLVEAGSSTGGAKRCSRADSLTLPNVYRDCEVDHQAKPRGNLGILGWQPPPNGLRSCYTTSVRYVVDETGVPMQGTVEVTQTNDGEHARAVAASVPSWRFTPAMKDSVAVKQWVETRHQIMAVVRVPGRVAPPPRRPLC